MISRILPEVVSNHIFPFLRFNDLLRLRRVSKVSKHLAEDYLRLYGASKRVTRIYVDEDSDHLTSFLALTYPIALTKFELVIYHNSSWDREEMQTFLDRHGANITHLKLRRLVIPLEPQAVQFFEALPNLIELRIGNLKEDGHDSSSSEGSDSESDDDQGPEVEPPSPDLNLSSTFKRLKFLHVTNFSCRPQLFLKFMEECSANLERVKYPGSGSLSEQLDSIRRIVERRHELHPGAPNLKSVDFGNFLYFDLSPNDIMSFYSLVTACTTHGVKLQHVNAGWIGAMMKLETPDRWAHEDKISRCVVSIKNLCKSVLQLELPLLEQICISYTWRCSMPEGDFQRQPWSNLQKLKLYVYSGLLPENGAAVRVKFYRLFEFLFHGIRRENLESLHLSFSARRDEVLPYPEIANVCSSCPNIKKLCFLRWPGSDEDIVQLWGNLRLLEDLTFWSCENLGDAAFIGDDVTRPAILEATRLKSLKLEGLESMPGITDNLFTSALRHMSLKALHLKSHSPVSSITLVGLESLLTGKFAETIEKFPLEGKIRLEGVTDDQLVELEGKFRSAQM